MSLDCYFQRKIVEYKEDEYFIENNLESHTMYEGGFVADKYNTFIEFVSGISLYSEELGEQDVLRISEQLREFNHPDRSDILRARGLSEEEFAELQKVFEYAANNKLVMTAWW